MVGDSQHLKDPERNSRINHTQLIRLVVLMLDLKIFNKQKLSWNKRYDSFKNNNSIPWKGNRKNELQPIFDKFNIHSGKALDIGCGEGDKSCYLSSIGFEVTGIDISSNAIKTAKRRCKNVDFLEHDIRDISSLGNNKYDLVLDLLTSHFLINKDKKDFIQGCYKILKPNGYYILDTYTSGVNIATPESEVEKLYSDSFEILQTKQRKSLYNSGAKLNLYVMKQI